MEISMRKSLAAMLVLVFLIASCLIHVKPVSASSPNSWTSKAPMQQARAGLGVAVVNGKIYAIGGSAENGVVGTNEEYDPASDTWRFKKSMPIPRYGFAIAVYQNKVYCIGGYTSNESIAGVNEVYDPATDTWETKTSMPTIRIGLQANVVNGKIYLIGGYPPAYYTSYNFSSSFLTLNEVYDPTTDSWTTKTPMPTAATNYASAVIDNKIYVIGGLLKSEDYTLNEIYDPATDKWRRGAPSPSITAYGAAGATTGVNAPKRIYVFGQDFSFREPPYINRVYDPATDTWTIGVPVPTERNGFGVAVVNDVFYVIGGSTQTYRDFPETWMYPPDITLYATNEQYTPFGYGTVPPTIRVVSPENKTYTAGNVSLAFTVNKPAAWIGYSLDGQDNVTVTENTTLSGLSSGLHNITVYARDEFENTGASDTICFSVAEEPFPVAPVAAASVATAVVVGTGLLVYFKKRKH
jgi:hypothetical protein